FQAEDGIRDFHVTGVQTCALPIYVVAGYIKAKGNTSVQSGNRLTLLRDADSDGNYELKTVFADNLDAPYGLALVGDTLYVANQEIGRASCRESGESRVVGGGRDKE